MKFIEDIKLRYRANSYKNKKDTGGIAYVISSVKPGDTVLDIGAHKAGYLYFILKQAGNQGRIFAFEPQSSLFKYLQRIKELFKWDNVTIEQLALSDKPGKATLYVPVTKAEKTSSPGATIVKHSGSPVFEVREEIQTDTLDSYCNRNDIKPDFMKIDVEGNELQVLKGGIEMLRKSKPKIIIEIEARHVGEEKALETFKFLEDLDYSGHFIKGLDKLPVSSFSFERYQNTNDMKNYCNNFTFE